MKKAVLWVLLLGILFGLYHAPSVVEASIPSIYYITPSLKKYENIIHCTGTVQPGVAREVLLDAAVVPAKVLVQVGDSVEKGDVLLQVDLQRTQALAAQPMQLLRQILSAQEEQDDALPEDIDLSALASLYGIGPIAGRGMDYARLEGILGGALGTSSARNITGCWVEGSASRYDITAPASGVVTGIALSPQVPAPAGKAVVTIADTESFVVMASVGEADVSKLKPGDTASLRGVGFGGKTYLGTITKIYPTARKSYSGAASDTVVDVEIRVEDPDKNLRPGYSAKVEIQGGENHTLLTVPYEAIRQDENNDEYVYIYADGKLQKNPVVTGQELTNEVQILAGLSQDSVVIFNPGEITKEGTMISIKGRADVH